MKGNIREGMKYYIESPSGTSEESGTFARKQFIGIVSGRNQLRFAEVREEIPPPKKEYDDEGRSLYPDKPVRRSKQ